MFSLNDALWFDAETPVAKIGDKGYCQGNTCLGVRACRNNKWGCYVNTCLGVGVCRKNK